MLEGLGPGSESSRLLKGMDPGEVLIRVRLASAFVRFATGRPESVRCRTPQTREYARRTLGEFLPGVTVERVQPQTLGPQGTGGFVFLGFALRSKPIGSAFRGLAEILTGIPPGGCDTRGTRRGSHDLGDQRGTMPLEMPGVAPENFPSDGREYDYAGSTSISGAATAARRASMKLAAWPVRVTGHRWSRR
jgi:hypothetical protein